MTTKQFKTIARLLKQAYQELEQEALENDIIPSSPEYQELQDKVREAVLAKAGFTIEEYREAKDKVVSEKKAEKDNSELSIGLITEVKDKLEELKRTKIPTTQEIKDIAEEVAKGHIKPPQIINQIVKEVVVEKPSIVRETKIEHKTERVEYDDTNLRNELSKLDSNIAKALRDNGVKDKELKDGLKDSVGKLHEDLKGHLNKTLQDNINMLGMPDFRKLAMGLQSQIDELRNNTSFEFYDIGEARRLSPDGILTRYKATADTDEARGTLLGLAQSEASSGDLIFVGPGTYEIAAVLGKDGVNWWFESGTLVQRVEGMIFSDGTENITTGGGTKMIYDVLGHGHFKSYGLAPVPMGGNTCIGTSHDDSDIRVECDKIENYDIIGDSAVCCLKGTISIVANRIYSDVYDGVIASTDCKKLNVHADYIYGGQDALEFLGGQVKIWANTVVGVDHAILGYSGGSGGCVYLNAREITGQIDLGSGTDLTIIEAQITHDNGDPAIILKGDGVVLNNCRIVSSPATNSITTGGSAQSFCVVGTLYVDRPIHADVTANNGFVYDSVTNEISTNRTLKASDFKDLGLLSKPVLGTDGTGKIVESTDGTHYLSPTTGFKLDQTTPQTITGTPTFPHLHITGTNESSLKITSTGGTRIASIELVRSGNDYYDVKLKNEAAHLYLQYSADDGTNWTTYADFYYSKTILSTPLDLESNNITTLGSGLFGDGSTSASVTVKGNAFPVLSAERYNATGTGTYSVTNLARRYTGAGSVSAGYGVGQYFKLSVSDSTHDQFAGVFGARWNNVANKVGELVFTPAYGNDDPFNDVPTFLVRSTQAGGSQSIIIDSTNKLYATSGTFNFDNDDIVTTGTVASGGYLVGATAGIDTTFVDNDGNTITVTKGIITAKVAP